MTKRSWPAFALIAACALTLAVLWPRERASVAAVPAGEIAAPESDSDALAAVEAPQASERVVAEAESLGNGPTAPSEAESPAPEKPTPEALELRGRLIALDQDGVERPFSRASFEVYAWRGSGGDRADVAVECADWSARIAPRSAAVVARLGPVTRLTFSDFVVDGSRATLDSPAGEIEPPLDGWLELRVRVPRPIALRVVGSDTHSDLSGVVLVRPLPQPRNDELHPGLDYEPRIAARELQSPIDLDRAVGAIELRRFSSVLVGRDGYAWNLVKLDVARGGDRVVSLERGGVLDLRVIGADALPDAGPVGDRGLSVLRSSRVELRLRREPPHSQPFLSADLGKRAAIEVAGLAPGRIWVRAEVGEWWNDPVVLGSVEVEIAADTWIAATLVVEPPPKVEGVRVTGRAWVPSSWARDGVLVTLVLLDVPQVGFQRYQNSSAERHDSEREGFERFDWSFECVQPGRCHLGLHDPPFLMGIEVPASTHAEFEIVVPPPVEVSVRVIDADTGVDVMVDAVMWHPVRPAGSKGGGVTPVHCDANTARYEFRAPAGTLQLWAQDQSTTMVCEAGPDTERSVVSSGSGGWTSIACRETLAVAGTRVEHTLRVRPTCGFVLRLKDGETFVPFPGDWQGAPQRVGGAGTSTGLQFESLSRRYTVSAPGEYTLELPLVEGFAAIPLQTVNVLAGEFTEHVVELVREP